MSAGDRIVGARYEIVADLGMGGHGSVHRAVDKQSGATVALKLLLLPSDPETEARFRREARAAQAIDHPNCVRVLDVGEDEEARVLYLAMEFIDGVTLDVALDRAGGRFEVGRATKIVLEILAALEAAHRAGVIHRDLKPMNIMMVGDTVKVCDFGSAKLLRRGITQLTKAGAVIGTGQYMAPEQARGLECDARADLYTAGALLYELMTGKPATRPSDRTPDVRFDDIFERSLADERERRFADASEMHKALTAAINTPLPSPPPRPPSIAPSILGSSKRRTVQIATVLVCAGALATIIFVFVLGSKHADADGALTKEREVCAVNKGLAEFVADRPLDVYAAGERLGRTPISVRSFDTGPLDLLIVDPRTHKKKRLRVYIEPNAHRIFELTKF